MRRFSRHEIRVFGYFMLATSWVWVVAAMVEPLCVPLAVLLSGCFAAGIASMEQAARDCEAFRKRLDKRRRRAG